MYICENCGALFEEPNIYIAYHGLESPPYEKFSGCPSCGSSCVETFICEYCGNYIEGEYVQLKNGDCYCEDCYSIKDIFDEV